MINHPNRGKFKGEGTEGEGASPKDWGINIETAKKVLEVVDAGLVHGVGKPVPGQMCVEAAVCYAMGLPHGDDPACVSRALRRLKIRLNDSKWSSNEARTKGLRRLALAQLGSRDVLDDREFTKRVAALAIRISVPIALRAAASTHKDPHHQQALRDAANKCEQDPTEKSARETRSVSVEARRAAYAADAAAYAADAAAHAAAHAAAYAADYAADAAAYAADAAAYAAYAAHAAAHAAADAADYAADAADYAADASERSALRARVSAEARDKALADFAEGVVQILIEMKAPGCQWIVLTEQAA